MHASRLLATLMAGATLLGAACTGTAEPAAAPSAIPTAGQSHIETACADLGESVLLLSLPGDQPGLLDVATGASCTLPFAAPLGGVMAMAGDDFFVVTRSLETEGGATVIRLVRADGSSEELPYTVTASETGTEVVALVVSDDGSRIAWSVLGPSGGGAAPSTGLYVADVASGTMLGGVSPSQTGDPRALVPIRFSDDGSMLFYALQPYGLGGAWSSYVGRYDNLYAHSVAAPMTSTLVFDCSSIGQGLCLGDFTVEDGAVASIAYVDRTEGRVIVRDASGAGVATFASDDDYVGYPTFLEDGTLLFYSAELSPDANGLAVSSALLHRTSPATAMDDAVGLESASAPPIAELDGRLIFRRLGDGGSASLLLVAADGSISVLAVPSDASVIGIPAVSPVIGLRS